MKAIQITFLVAVALVALIPLLLFNFEEGAISEIDNRVLAANPFSNKSEARDLSNDIESYINDRIGLRDEMILSYTVLHDKIFRKMVHPLYTYGREGYVFGAGITGKEVTYTEFHEAYADMVKEIQDYCDARGVPFIFVFDPAKPAVLTEYLPRGVNYDRTWVNDFLAALDERGIRYIDNTVTMREAFEAGEPVFNQKYDANHWNAIGAYYGTKAVLQELQKDYPTIHINDLNEEGYIYYDLVTSLPVSAFPIEEYVPRVAENERATEEMVPMYEEELYRHPSHIAFKYFRNQQRMQEGAPKALVFQGSYMNKFQEFFSDAFGEYIFVHDYQNVMDFAYYFNIFQPEVVIFEVAEYTMDTSYFDYERVRDMELNPVLNQVEYSESKFLELSEANMSVEEGNTLTKICWSCFDGEIKYAWLCMDIAYDMKKTENGYEVTVHTETYHRYKENMSFAVLSDGAILSVYGRGKM